MMYCRNRGAEKTTTALREGEDGWWNLAHSHGEGTNECEKGHERQKGKERKNAGSATWRCRLSLRCIVGEEH